MQRLARLTECHPQLRVRGLGLMIGVEVVDGTKVTACANVAAAIQRTALAAGVLLITSIPEANAIRILPPLVITDDELAHGLDVSEQAAGQALAGP